MVFKKTHFTQLFYNTQKTVNLQHFGKIPFLWRQHFASLKNISGVNNMDLSGKLSNWDSL